jgi:hypothetical protein
MAPPGRGKCEMHATLSTFAADFRMRGQGRGPLPRGSRNPPPSPRSGRVHVPSRLSAAGARLVVPAGSVASAVGMRLEQVDSPWESVPLATPSFTLGLEGDADANGALPVDSLRLALRLATPADADADVDVRVRGAGAEGRNRGFRGP